MKIVFSTDQTYLHGGTEKVLAEKANYLVRNLGYDVYIITTEQKQKEGCYYLDARIHQIDLGINYHRELSYLHPKNLLKIFKHFKNLKKLIKNIKPKNWVVCNFAFDFFFIPFIEKDIPKIKEFHGSQFMRKKEIDKSSFFKSLVFKIQLIMESKYDTLVVLNPDEEKYFDAKNTVVIPNPIQIYDAQAKLENKLVIAAGRIAPVKGFDRLIKAWALVAQKYPDWTLHIYGVDYLGTQASLESLLAELQIQDNVKFIGATSNMIETMLNYSMYLMTSITECFPMVLLESLSIGLPIIAFDVPTGPRNIISDRKDGLLIENNNIMAYAQAIESLITDNELRVKMGEQAKLNSVRFNQEKVLNLWNNLLSK